MDIISICENSKSTECSKTQQLEDIVDNNNKIEDVFPWLPKFNKVIRSSAGSRNYQYLEQSILLYTQNILSSVAANNVKFNLAINLKNHINNMLTFFYLYWLDIKQDIADHSSYLNKMSALLNVYIDMELKTSIEKRTFNHVKDSSKIAAKILAALCIYLNNSEEHIFKVLLRIKYTTEKYTKIYNYIFTKSFINLKTKTTMITDVAYVRYLLAFKMWKKMEETSEKKERINKLAVMLLGPRMPKLQDKLLEFIPRPSMGQRNETLWLLQSSVFDLKQAHKKFLLFEDKMDKSAVLQCTKTIRTDQNCLKSEKHQMSYQMNRNNSNAHKPNQDINKDCLDDLHNHNIVPSINRNKFLDQTYLKKKGTKRLKTLKKIRKKSEETIIIDLTQDEEISIPCKAKRKKIKRNVECLRIMKNIIKNKKHINLSKYSSRFGDTDTKESSNKDSERSIEKIPLNCKPISDNKVSDSTKSCTSISSRSSLNDTTNSINSNPIMQSKEVLTSQEENVMETIPLFKMCQNSNTDQHSFKQELPTSTNCNAMQKSHKCCETMPVDVHDIKHLIIKKLKSINDHSSQITEIIKQKVCHQVNECPNCSAKIDCKPFVFTNNDVTATKMQETLHNTFNDNEDDVKLACDTNIIYMLSDRNKCVYVVNHIGERVLTMHTEKKVQCLDKSNDICTVSTTFTGDQVIESPLYSQHVNFDNVKMNDYANATKYSETIIKEQQKRSDCDSAILSDRIYSSEPCTFDINSFDIGSNTEIDYELKNLPKIEEANEITKTDCIDDLEHISFLNNLQSETLEDFLRQSSAMSQINYDNSTGVSNKKLLVCADNAITAVKTQDTLYNMFNNENDIKSSCDTNILSDREKCIYVANHNDEHVITTNVEKRVQGSDYSNDIYTVSTTFTGDQIVESSFDGQHINFDKKKCDYEDGSTCSEAIMKEQQGRSDCDTSILNDQLNSSELYTFDIDPFEMDSKEANEIMKTDCIDDFENISFLHNIQTETLEDVLSSGTTDFFLPLKQSPFELDNVYTDTFLNKKDVLCNNQNDIIDSSADSVAFRLNNDNTFLRLPVKSDKSIFQGAVEFRYPS